MIDISLSLVMDGIVIVLLAATIFFAVRLSRNLKNFRDSRKDLQQLINDLSQSIVRAEGAIEGLREAARQGGRDLQETINAAKGLSEELQIMTESGERIASRLESGSSVARQKTAAPAGQVRKQRRRIEEEPAFHPVKHEEDIPQPAPKGGFMIRDPEVERDDVDEDDESLLFDDEGDDFEAGGNMQSQAEKDLYDALKKQRNKTEAGGVS